MSVIAMLVWLIRITAVATLTVAILVADGVWEWAVQTVTLIVPGL
jgi:hypothetical protein